MAVEDGDFGSSGTGSYRFSFGSVPLWTVKHRVRKAAEIGGGIVTASGRRYSHAEGPARALRHLLTVTHQMDSNFGIYMKSVRLPVFHLG